MKLFENKTIRISNIHTVLTFFSEQEFSKGAFRRFSSYAPNYELIFFISGEFLTTFNGKELHDVPGSIRFLPKGDIPKGYFVKNLSAGVCIDIFFDTADPMPDHAMSLKNMDFLKPLFQKIFQVWTSKKTGYYAQSMSILYEIIKNIQQHNNIYRTTQTGQKVLPSQQYLLEHFCEPNFDFQEMCRVSGLSYDYFKELFIREYGMTPRQYLTAHRLDKAKELLLTGHLTVTEIAEHCGFDNVYYFSNVFKKHAGISPKQYQEQMRNTTT